MIKYRLYIFYELYYGREGNIMQAGNTKYLLIYKELKKEIISGIFTIGETFPSEPELQARFGASRITVRHSVQMLVDDGYLQRIVGVGTVVISQKSSLQLQTLMSFSEENKNTMSQSTILSYDTELKPSALISSKLKLSNDLLVSCQERLRWVDEIPIGYQRVYCPQFIGLSEEELGTPNISLYKLLKEKGYIVKNAEETIESIVANQTYAKYLQVKEGSPLLFIQRVTSDEKERIVEYAEIVYRGDMYRYKVQLTAQEEI
jgi:GntR family transcriptional regulator